MADAPAEQQAQEKGKRKLGTLVLLGGMFLGEAVLILGVMALFGGPPEVQGGSVLEETEVPPEEKVVEELIVEARFPNSRRGPTYLYETEIYIQVKRRHQQLVAAELEQFRNEIKAELATIWRTSDPGHFEEPKLETLTRKVYALMSNRFGMDSESEEPIVQKVVIVMGTGFRVDA